MKKILVNGANGWLGRSVIKLAGPEFTAPGVREDRGGYESSVLIGSDGQIERDSLSKFDTIINCAGRVKGKSSELEQANIVHAFRLAKSAKSEGIRRFVQVSSFSIYGNTELISSQTPSSPATAYGRSKLNAENALLSLCSSDFTVTCVRLPFMFSVSKPALIGDLINALRTLPCWPTLPHPIQRSMLTYDAAADFLLQAAVDGPPGVVAVADPHLFSIERLVGTMRHYGLSTAKLVPVPLWCAAPVRHFFPGIGRRLFQSSVLHDEYNWGRNRIHGVGIDPEIEAILAQKSVRLSI